LEVPQVARFFSPDKAKIRGNPDGFQEFLAQYGGKRSANGCADNFQTRPELELCFLRQEREADQRCIAMFLSVCLRTSEKT
jgi:hypothetical protein